MKGRKTKEKLVKIDNRIFKNTNDMIKQSGITMLALVITIIILLILAGVTINMATSGSGVFDRAKNAANFYKESAEEENEGLETLGNEIGKYIQKADEVSKDITYTDTAGNTQTLTEDTPVGTKIGTTVVDGQTLDWYLFDTDATTKKAYLVSTPVYWVPDTTKEVKGAYTPKLIEVYDSDTHAIRQAIQKLANGTDTYNSSSVTYRPSENTLTYYKKINSKWSAKRGNVAFANLNENEQAACYLADEDIFAGIKNQANNADGSLKGKIESLVGGASIEQWETAYNKQTAISKKITCEYSEDAAPGYIYKVDGTAQNAGQNTGQKTVFGNAIYGAAGTKVSSSPFKVQLWLLASPSSGSSKAVSSIYGRMSSVAACGPEDSYAQLSLFARVALQ